MNGELVKYRNSCPTRLIIAANHEDIDQRDKMYYDIIIIDPLTEFGPKYYRLEEM